MVLFFDFAQFSSWLFGQLWSHDTSDVHTTGAVEKKLNEDWKDVSEADKVDESDDSEGNDNVFGEVLLRFFLRGLYLRHGDES